MPQPRPLAVGFTLTVLCGACGGSADPGDPPATPATPATPGTPTTPGTPNAPGMPFFPDVTDPNAPAGSAEMRSVQACSLPDQRRVAFQGRDDATDICTDFILVPLDRGGVPLAQLALPAGWGVGHMSGYRCTPDGVILPGDSRTVFTQGQGSVSFGANDPSLPRSVELAVGLWVPNGTAGSAGALPRQGVYATNTDVSAVCGAAAVWARQALNVDAAVSSTFLDGCTGRDGDGTDHIELLQRDAVSGRCTELFLISPASAGRTLPNLSLPDDWAASEMTSFPCTHQNAPSDGAAATPFVDASGYVRLAGAFDYNGAFTQHLSLDVLLLGPAAQSSPGAPPGAELATQLQIENLELSRSCYSLR